MLRLDTCKNYSGTILRVALGLVVLWFGYSQVMNPQLWGQSYVPQWITTDLAVATTFSFYNGIFELIIAAMLLLGLGTRVASGLLFLHLAAITVGVGYNEIGVRDFGLTLASLALFFHGITRISLDRIILKFGKPRILVKLLRFVEMLVQ